MTHHRQWRSNAALALHTEERRAGRTPVLRIPLPWAPDIDLYVKDETAHPSGNLKHRLARYLVENALASDALTSESTLVDASSGSTAIAESYFASMLGLRMVAVIPPATSPSKVKALRSAGAGIHTADPRTITAVARELGSQPNHVYLDQFGNAARVTEWRSARTLAAEILDQLAGERYPIPEWCVVGVGTGGTSAAMGRHLRWAGTTTRLCVAEPEFSAHFAAWSSNDRDVSAPPSRIEGIGRPSVSPSFVPEAVDRMIRVRDDWSLAAMQVASEAIGKTVGPSTGTNIYAALTLIAEILIATELALFFADACTALATVTTASDSTESVWVTPVQSGRQVPWPQMSDVHVTRVPSGVIISTRWHIDPHMLLPDSISLNVDTVIHLVIYTVLRR